MRRQRAPQHRRCSVGSSKFYDLPAPPSDRHDAFSTMYLIGISDTGALRRLCLNNSRMRYSVPATKGYNDNPHDASCFQMCNVKIRISKKAEADPFFKTIAKEFSKDQAKIPCSPLG